jgi:hypothetical protein
MENYPACDAEVRSLAAELWGDQRSESGQRPLGSGRVVWGKTLEEVLGPMGAGPDFLSETPLRFTHRSAGAADIYFVANPRPEEVAATAAFRAGRRQPELWWPETGRREQPAVYRLTEAGVQMPLVLAPHESVFVVFRQPAEGVDPVVSVSRDGQTVLDTDLNVDRAGHHNAADPAAGDFSFALWVKPAADTTLLPEADSGVHGMAESRNDVIFPPHGQTFGAGSRAGSGLAVGRNGVCVFEHGGNYFAPVLVHPAAIDEWTHVAVVYRGGQPHLYLDGQFARRGLKSQYMVHSGAAAGGSGSPFRGDLGTIEAVARPLADEEIAAWARSMPRPGTRRAAGAIELYRDDSGQLAGRAWEAGNYALQMASGKKQSLAVAAVAAPLEIAGPWQVRFVSGADAPHEARFEKLVDWAERSEPAIRYYSGAAVYSTTFELPQNMAGKPVSLRLGKVRDLALVRLNGQQIGTLWKAPWTIDVTSAVRPGVNKLELEIVNVWNNRLVGDSHLPPDERQTFLAVDTMPKNALLLPAGLLGPVTLEAAEAIAIGLKMPTQAAN